jgi:hypothetical protein
MVNALSEVYRKSLRAATLTGLCALFLALYFSQTTHAAVIPITFPVIGSASYSNDFNAPRSGGPHHAIDIIAGKHQKVVAAADGSISFVPYPQPSYGYMIRIQGNDGYTYNYIHLNNDSPGTDDGKGGGMNAYAPDMVRTYPVVKGQHIGYVGDSGNAENTVSHLHFEIYRGSTAVNPYDSLNAARRISTPSVYPQLSNEILPYTYKASFPVSLAIGNVDTVSDNETITGAGPGGGPHVKIFKPNKAVVGGFFAYNSTFRGGIDVAVGNVDDDPQMEIITGPTSKGGPQVKMFNNDGTVIGGFFADVSTDRQGINVAAADIDNDGRSEIIVTPASGDNARVKIFKSDGTLIRDFPTYSSAFASGVDVAIGDLNNDGNKEIVTGAEYRGGSHVLVFNTSGALLRSFFAYDSAFRGGVKVAVGNALSSRAGDEIVTVPMAVGGPHLKVFSDSGSLLYEKYFVEEWWRGSINDVAAQGGTIKASIGGNRRSSIKDVLN